MDWTYFLGKAIFAFILMNVALVIVAYLVYFERKVAAHMQARMGPNRAGPIGLFQSFADLIKMLRKENTVPADADKVVFFIAPLVSTLASVGLLAVGGAATKKAGAPQHPPTDIVRYWYRTTRHTQTKPHASASPRGA